MGISLSWLAVRDGRKDSILRQIGFAETGELLDYPEEPCAAELPTGWHLVVLRKAEHAAIGPSSLARLSAGGTVVACSIEEHVMYSAATCWVDGQERWAIRHDAQISGDNLTVTGTPPDGFEATRDAYIADQAADAGDPLPVDFIFEIPLVTARKLVGFKHDEGGEGNIFSRLRPSPSTERRPWWKVW